MSYNKTVNDFQFRWMQGLINPWNMIFTLDALVNIMFHGLINPCIHLIKSHQLYNIPWDDNDALFVLDQHTNMDIYSASSLKQQCVGTHDASPRKIILFPCQPEPVFALTPFNYDYQNIYTSKTPQLYLYDNCL